jgi:hypothetical protein
LVPLANPVLAQAFSAACGTVATDTLARWTRASG